ncbi:hypothetical protein M9H77_29979 [Catharanthus roseus]|uniref:Uncharacterized protein n=1 Tax=Catharanthus roseus TaxID=4058 RepID=A0ACB9ZX92_CATRO|nr:hypothetical protein M9H77_29979 [Catharanthus roseus]
MVTQRSYRLEARPQSAQGTTSHIVESQNQLSKAYAGTFNSILNPTFQEIAQGEGESRDKCKTWDEVKITIREAQTKSDRTGPDHRKLKRHRQPPAVPDQFHIATNTTLFYHFPHACTSFCSNKYILCWFRLYQFAMYKEGHTEVHHGIEDALSKCNCRYSAEENSKGFASWFNNEVHNPLNASSSKCLRNLAWGTSRLVKSYNQYLVNKFRFHTQKRDLGSLTYNCGVHIKRRYAGGYDRFILAQQAEQVYFIPYPMTKRQKSDWWTVMKSRPCVLDVPLVDIPFQENVDSVDTSMIDVDIQDVGPLIHEPGDSELVDLHEGIALIMKMRKNKIK